MTPKFPDVKVKLVGEDGNAFAIMARVSKALRREGVRQSDIDAFVEEATKGNFDNLLQIVMKTVTVDDDDEEE